MRCIDGMVRTAGAAQSAAGRASVHGFDAGITTVRSKPVAALFTAAILLLTLLFSARARAVDPFLDWHTLTSDNFHVHFAAGHRDHAERALRIAENAHRRLSVSLNWQPAEPTHLVLSDETDFANGYATVININRSVLFMAPPTGVGGLEDFDDWLNLLITHEYVHVLHLDRAENAPAVLRDVFGRFLLSFPNLFEPAWLIEGLATWYETDIDRGIGRGQSTFFESMMRAEVADGIKPVSQVNLPISTWPSGATRYLYGVYFFLFLEEVYGEAAIQRLVDEYSINLVPWSINSAFQRAFGKDVNAMWDEYSAWLQARFGAQIEALRQQGIVAGKMFSDSAYATRHVRATADAVYYIRNNGDDEERLVKRARGEQQALVETRNANFDVRDDGDIIISQLEVCDEYAIYYDLYLYDAAADELNRLTECGRYQRAIWAPGGERIYALRHASGIFELQVLDSEARLLRRLHLFDEGDVPGWMDVAPDDSELVLSLWRDDLGWNLYRMSTADGRLAAITRDNRVQAYPEYSADGEHIYYSAEYADAYDLYRLPAAGGQHERITRTLTGALQSSATDEGIYYTAYTAQGSSTARLDDVRAIATQQLTAGEPIESYDFAAVEASESAYSPWPALQPAWWFPTLVLTEDITEIGFTTAANDALGIHNYFAAAAWDLDNDVASLSASYAFSNLFSAGLQRDNDLFRDAAGNKARMLQSDQLQFVFALPDTGLQSSSAWLMALSWEQVSDAKLYNGAAPINDFSDNLFGLAWLYSNAERYPLSISLNDGRRISILAEDGSLLDSDLDGRVYTLSWQEYIGLGGEHVLALRALFGRGDGTTSRFQLGGEDTGVSYDLFLNRSGEGLFGRRDYALRGYEDGLPQLRGRNARLYSAEWRFPGQRVERGRMLPPIGIMQWYGTLFAETGAAWDSGSVDEFYSSIGAEFNADLNIGYLVPLTARLGIAHGLDDSIGDTRAYLSLGASF